MYVRCGPRQLFFSAAQRCQKVGYPCNPNAVGFLDLRTPTCASPAEALAPVKDRQLGLCRRKDGFGGGDRMWGTTDKRDVGF